MGRAETRPLLYLCYNTPHKPPLPHKNKKERRFNYARYGIRR